MPTFEELLQEAQARLRELEGGEKPWIRVGAAVCGEAAGASETLAAIRAELESRGIDANVSIVGCLGLCYAEPLVDVQKPGGSRVFYRNVTPDKAAELVASCVAGDDLRPDMALAYTGRVTLDGIPRLDDLPVWSKQVRIALRNCGHIDPLDIYQYVAQGGYAALEKAVNRMKPEDVLKEVQDSGLRGRGGAAFPTGTKWSFLSRSPGPVKYILCNCEEGDPGAYNDKGILESDPHSLIEGTILAGYATGASNGVVFIRHGHEGPIHRTERAIEQAYELGLLGDDILGSGFSFHVEVSLTGESYVAGEETALMESVEGNRAMPRARPPFPAQSGVWGLPSNINNIKSLAYVSEIVSRGGEWFAGIGTEGSKGTAILCLSGNITLPGMVEVPMGMTIREVIDDVMGGVPNGRKTKFLQTGGPLGGVLPADLARRATGLRGDGPGGRNPGLRRHHRCRRPRLRREHDPRAGGLLPVRVVREVLPVQAGHDQPHRDSGADMPLREQTRGPGADAPRGAEHGRGLTLRSRPAWMEPGPVGPHVLPGRFHGPHGRGAVPHGPVPRARVHPPAHPVALDVRAAPGA